MWEFWAYNVVFGLFQAPYYAFSQTMMAELTPPGFDNMVRPALRLRARPSQLTLRSRPPFPFSPPSYYSFSACSGCRTARRR